jgi:hypothetical protein
MSPRSLSQRFQLVASFSPAFWGGGTVPPVESAAEVVDLLPLIPPFQLDVPVS